MRRRGRWLSCVLIAVLLLTSVFMWNGLSLVPRPLSDLEEPMTSLQLVSRRQASIAMPLCQQEQELSARLYSTYIESLMPEALTSHRLNRSVWAEMRPCYVLLAINHPQHAPPVA